VRTLAALALATGALAAGCSGGDEPAAAPATTGERAGTTEPAGVAFETGEVVIETDGAHRTLTVEIAETPEEQQLGLMFREALPRASGMVFIFPEDHRGGFWMKNTLVPLSIAFYDGSGRIVSILDMEPCRRDPCPVYDPGVAYRGALEVNQGLFADWGVSVGDRIRVER
jgi:uncharacterized membrane protein (UPF0127 family)